MLVAVAGCSFATMRSPHGTPPECVDKQAAPFVDALITVASPFVAYAVLAAEGFPNTDDGTGEHGNVDAFIRGVAAVGVSFPVWAIAGTSSVYGFVKADRCYRAKRDYQQLMNAQQPPP